MLAGNTGTHDRGGIYGNLLRRHLPPTKYISSFSGELKRIKTTHRPSYCSPLVPRVCFCGTDFRHIDHLPHCTAPFTAYVSFQRPLLFTIALAAMAAKPGRSRRATRRI